MAPFQRTRLALFKKGEATRNKEVIDISDDEVMSTWEDAPVIEDVLPPTLTFSYCETCGKKIVKGERYCDMCCVTISIMEDLDLFGYSLNEPVSPMEEENPNSHRIASPEPERPFCAFCGWEIPEDEGGYCKECTLQAARERDFKVLGYVPYYLNISSPEEEPFSPAALEITEITEEEEDPEEEEDF